jgi:hypothetical protein
LKQGELLAKEQVLGNDGGVGEDEQPDKRKQPHILQELVGSFNDTRKLGPNFCGAQG